MNKYLTSYLYIGVLALNFLLDAISLLMEKCIMEYPKHNFFIHFFIFNFYKNQGAYKKVNYTMKCHPIPFKLNATKSLMTYLFILPIKCIMHASFQALAEG